MTLAAEPALAQAPGPSSVEKFTDAPPFDGAQGYVVIPDTLDVKQHDDAADCIAKALSASVPTGRPLPLESFKDALYPWMEPTTKPRNPAQLEEWMARPLVKARLQEIRVRYLISVYGRSSDAAWGQVGYCGLVRCPGKGFYTSRTQITVSVWDLNTRSLLGRSNSEKEKTGFEGGLSPLIPITITPDTVSPACAEAAAPTVRAMAAGTQR